MAVADFSARRDIVLALASLVFFALFATYSAGLIFLVRHVASNPLEALESLRLSTWWSYWRAHGDDTVTRASLELAAVDAGKVALVPLAAVAFFALRARFAQRQTPQHGEARFATRAEARSAKLLDGEGLLAGRLVGAFGRPGPYVTVREHTACIAPTGADKGVGFVIPNLLSWPGSAIVLDLKGENHQITSAYRERAGQRVFVWNPFATDRRTHAINLFDALPAEHHARVSGIMEIAQRFYPAENDPVWAPSARNLFVACALVLDETANATLSLGEVLREGTGRGRETRQHLLSVLHRRNYRERPTGRVDEEGEPEMEFVELGAWDGIGEPPLSDAAVSALTAFTASEGRPSKSIIFTFTAALTLWSDPLVDRATATSDLLLADFRRTPTTLYVCIPANKVASAAPLLGPFFSALFGALSDELDGGGVPTLALLDEIVRLRYQPAIEAALSLIRGYGVTMCSVLQSRGQIMDSPPAGYGVHGAKAFLDGHPSKIVFAPEDEDDAQHLSKLLGTQTITTRTRPAGALSFKMGTESDAARPLLLPQELMAMSRDDVLIRTRRPAGGRQKEGLRTVRAKKVRYYEDRDMLARLASVSPRLNAVPWYRRPRRDELEDAIVAGELATVPPVIDLPPVRVASIVPVEPTRTMTLADVPAEYEPALDLSRVALDLDDVPEIDGPPVDEAEVRSVVDAIWSALDNAPFPDDAPVNRESGEIDLSLLDEDASNAA